MKNLLYREFKSSFRIVAATFKFSRQRKGELNIAGGISDGIAQAYKP